MDAGQRRSEEYTSKQPAVGARFIAPPGWGGGANVHTGTRLPPYPTLGRDKSGPYVWLFTCIFFATSLSNIHVTSPFVGRTI